MRSRRRERRSRRQSPPTAARRRAADSNLTLTIYEGARLHAARRDLRCAEVGNVGENCTIRVRGARRLRGCGRGSGERRRTASYEFLAAPQINLSLVYRLDKLTGDVIACQFAHNPGRTDVGPARSGSPTAIAAARARPSRSRATTGSSPRATSRKAACSASITAPALSASAIFISSARSRAITRWIADQYVVCTPQWRQPTAAARPGRRGQRIAGASRPRPGARLTRRERRRPTADLGVVAGLGPAIHVFCASNSLLTAIRSPRRADALLWRTHPFKRVPV